MTWPESKEACAGISGHLIHPEDMEFMNLVTYLGKMGKGTPRTSCDNEKYLIEDSLSLHCISQGTPRITG